MGKLAVILGVILLLAGCNPFDSSNYQGLVVSVDETSFMLCPCEGNPEAEYPIYEIFVGNDTEIVGVRTEFMEIEQGDEVRVWVKDEEAAELVGERISVESKGE